MTSEFKDEKFQQMMVNLANDMLRANGMDRKKRLDELANPSRLRIREIYSELDVLFKELSELGDGTWQYGGRDCEYEVPIQFYGKYFSFMIGDIEEI
jgi:hypothetical protein